LPQSGLVRQEDIRLADFLDNRFGRSYAGPETPTNAQATAAAPIAAVAPAANAA
jgi:hypothetical protein